MFCNYFPSSNAPKLSLDFHGWPWTHLQRPVSVLGGQQGKGENIRGMDETEFPVLGSCPLQHPSLNPLNYAKSYYRCCGSGKERKVSYLFDNRLWDSVWTDFSIQVQQGIQVTCSAIKQLIWKFSICAYDCSV